ncbi:MAG: hypothetical protein HY231_11980 [Acidobacteria bacterium]|nr:hypothetical protein [Acidobacteriota bacterium]
MKGAKVLFLASWVILLGLSGFIGLTSLGSLRVAYFSEQDSLTSSLTLEQVKGIGGDEAVNTIKTLRGRRVTAATWALAAAVLAFFVALFPYRRGERWAWWALLVGLGLSQILSALRYVIIGTSPGAGTAMTIVAVLLLALLAGVPRLFRQPDIDEIKVE